jgi:hypothetical protein
MANRIGPSRRLWINWVTDASLLLVAIVAILSGVYFLFFPIGGFQGGRNPSYGIMMLFERHIWEELHVWTGLGMIGVALLHLAIHWRWVVSMVRCLARAARGGGPVLTRGGWYNLVLNGMVGISFVLTSISGVYFLLPPDQWLAEVLRGLLIPVAWDLLHTWAGIVLIVALMLHLDIHRGWIVKVSRRVLQTLVSAPSADVQNASEPAR